MVHLNGVLMPIGDLVNGDPFQQWTLRGTALCIFHIELETHDVIFADGAPCETLLTTAEKLAVFDNADEYHALYGAPMAMKPYARLATFNGRRSD